MAAIVLGIGMSHGAMLSVAPEAWDDEAHADKSGTALPYRGAAYSWAALSALRGGAFAKRNTPEARRAQRARCDASLDALAAALARAKPDAVLVVGDDGPGVEYPPVPGLAAVLDDRARAERFPVALDRASGVVVARLLSDRGVPLARLRFDPAATDAERCFAFGSALGRAVRGWGGERRVAVIAVGGMSHPVIDEALDRRLLEAVASGDPVHVVREPEATFRAGAAGIKNWIVAAGALDHAGLDMVLIDYVPCIRTEAGTGHAMAFAVWS
jgi:hypothetical protein